MKFNERFWQNFTTHQLPDILAQRRLMRKLQDTSIGPDLAKTLKDTSEDVTNANKIKAEINNPPAYYNHYQY